MQATPTHQPRHGLPGEALWALRRSKAGAIALRRHRRKAVARLAQPIHVRHKVWIMGPLVRACDRTTEAMRTGHAPGPRQRHIDLCTRLMHSDRDALHQQAYELLAVLCGRFRCLPPGGDLPGQAPDRLTCRRRQLTGPLAAESGMLFLQLLLMTERLFPTPLHLPGHQAIVRLDGFILPRGPLGAVVRPLQALVPRGLSLRAFGTQSLLHGHPQLERRRLEHLHDLCGNKALQERPGQAEAAGHPVINGRPHTRGAQVLRLAAGGRQPAPPAPPTDEQAHHEGGAFAGSPEGCSDGTVVSEALRDRGKALPAHGRGEALWDQDVTRIGGVDGPPRAASARRLLARV
jgi:hypothetical protein